jgi:hypothetical protein
MTSLSDAIDRTYRNILRKEQLYSNFLAPLLWLELSAQAKTNRLNAAAQQYTDKANPSERKLRT